AVLSPKADICGAPAHVRLGPKADMSSVTQSPAWQGPIWPVLHPHASPTKASTKVAAASLSCLRPYPARSITASPLVKVTTTRASRFASIAANLLGAEL